MIQPGDILLYMEAASKSGLSIHEMKRRVDHLEGERVALPQLCIWQKFIPEQMMEHWDELNLEIKLKVLVSAEYCARSRRSECEDAEDLDQLHDGRICKICRRFGVTHEGGPSKQSDLG